MYAINEQIKTESNLATPSLTQAIRDIETNFERRQREKEMHSWMQKRISQSFYPLYLAAAFLVCSIAQDAYYSIAYTLEHRQELTVVAKESSAPVVTNLKAKQQQLDELLNQK